MIIEADRTDRQILAHLSKNVRMTNKELAHMVADVSNEAAVTRLVGMLEDEFGKLDVLINNAGVSGPTGLIEDLDIGESARRWTSTSSGSSSCSRQRCR